MVTTVFPQFSVTMLTLYLIASFVNFKSNRWKINGGKEMVDVRLVTGVMSGSGVRKDQRVVDRTLE